MQPLLAKPASPGYDWTRMSSHEPSPAPVVRVAAVIPTFNAREHLAGCLAAVQRLQPAPELTIVVDDGSRDGTVDFLRREWPCVAVVSGSGTWWWAESVNQGIRRALAEDATHVLLLNDDNRPEPGALGALLTAARGTPARIVCSLVLFDGVRDEIQFAGGVMRSRWGGLESRHAGRTLAKTPLSAGEVTWCGGMGVLIPRAVLARVGLLDAHAFPQYYGDADYCFRARRKGCQVWFEPASVIRNCGAKTGLRLADRPQNLAALFEFLTSRKSPYNVHRAARFYFRHFNPLFALVSLGGKYLDFAGQWRRAVRTRAAGRGPAGTAPS